MAVIALALGWLAHNTLLNMRERGIQSGFDFLRESAGFDIGEGFISKVNSNGLRLVRSFLLAIILWMSTAHRKNSMDL